MKKYKGEILIVLGCILIIGITVTFAYFLANIEGEGKSIILKSKNLKITFTESNNLSGENISPGWSKTSTFIVKNEGKMHVRIISNMHSFLQVSEAGIKRIFYRFYTDNFNTLWKIPTANIRCGNKGSFKT